VTTKYGNINDDAIYLKSNTAHIVCRTRLMSESEELTNALTFWKNNPKTVPRALVIRYEWALMIACLLPCGYDVYGR
jgi:hypothetical protein